VLTTLAQLMAPIIPHVADEIWDNLVAGALEGAPDSVHLVDFPRRTSGRADPVVDYAVELARRTVTLGRAARSASSVRTRQPLRVARIKLPGARSTFADDPAVDTDLRREIAEELNVRAIELIPDESEMVERTLYPLLPVVGPRHGPAVGAIMAAARSGAWSLTDDGTVQAGGTTLQPDEFRLTARARPGNEVAEDGDLLVALDTGIDAELAAEGLARELAHRLQAMRKAAGFEISDRVRVAIAGGAGEIAPLVAHRDWLGEELLARSLEIGPDASLEAAEATESVDLDGVRLRLSLSRA
jgi:isoleucyl-tRNA synthetase